MTGLEFAQGIIIVVLVCNRILVHKYPNLKTTDKMENNTSYLPGDYRVAEYIPGEFKVQVYSFRQFTTSSFWGGRKLQREYYWQTITHPEPVVEQRGGATVTRKEPIVFTTLTSAREYIAEHKRISQEYPKFHNA